MAMPTLIMRFCNLHGLSAWQALACQLSLQLTPTRSWRGCCCLPQVRPSCTGSASKQQACLQAAAVLAAPCDRAAGSWRAAVNRQLQLEAGAPHLNRPRTTAAVLAGGRRAPDGGGVLGRRQRPRPWQAGGMQRCALPAAAVRPGAAGPRPAGRVHVMVKGTWGTRRAMLLPH